MRKMVSGAMLVVAILAIGCGSKPAEEPVPAPETTPMVTPEPTPADTTAPAATDTTAAATH